MATSAGSPGGLAARAAHRPLTSDSTARPAEAHAARAAAEVRRDALSPAAGGRPAAQPETSLRLGQAGAALAQDTYGGSCVQLRRTLVKQALPLTSRGRDDSAE